MSGLYEKIGGDAAVDAAVDEFYRRMLSDERVAKFFDDVDMDGQRSKQKAFLGHVLGGPKPYTGKDMRAAHAGLLERGLDDSHVDVVIQHLGETLASLGVAAEDIAEVGKIAESARDDILGR